MLNGKHTAKGFMEIIYAFEFLQGHMSSKNDHKTVMNITVCASTDSD